MDLWPFGRQLVEANGFGLTGLFQLGLELGAAIDLDGLDRERHLGMTFSSLKTQSFQAIALSLVAREARSVKTPAAYD
jgi:hypothetical protein